jgi:hypothetical protein
MTSTDPKPDENPSETPVADTAADAAPAHAAPPDAPDAAGDPAAQPDAVSTPSPTEPAAPPQPSVVYVEAPKPPRARGARGVGVLVALLATGIFAVVYAAAAFLLGRLVPSLGIDGGLADLASRQYWIPVVIFALAHILLVVALNRAGWWGHVLGGFLVALVVWIGFLGAALISAGLVGAPAPEVGAELVRQLGNPLGFAAAVVAREVPIWVGWIVARRGRTARARNAAARAAYEQELAEHRATVGGSAAV